MELLARYSGITAIIVYLFIFWVYLQIKKNRKPAEETAEEPVRMAPVAAEERYPLDVNDEDATVAALIASIEYRQEKGTDVRVLSVREVR